MSVYLAAGVAVFAHECEGHRHSVTVGWSAGDSALDERTLPPCRDCGAPYEQVAACPAGVHECHPISGHVERSDDPAIGLVPAAEPDPLALKAQRRAFVQWVIGQQQVIAQTAALLEADKFPSAWLREDCQLTHDLAIAALAAHKIDPAA